jgi:hypothetical protein
MKAFSRLLSIATAITVSATLVASVGSATAAPAPTAPPRTLASGPQAKAPFEAGSRDAQRLQALGSTKLVKTDTNGTMQGVTTLAGSVANVDFQSPLNYCSRSLTYTPVRNTTTATKYIQVRVYNQGSYRDIYTSVAANSYAYPAFYGNDGAFTAYLYVWNGTSYVYDEYVSGTNTCKVSVTRTYNTGGWVQLKIQNLGTAYASQQSTELAPYPASGTYTGTHYDYPVAGGAAIYRWFSVGTSPYGIVSTTLGSYNSPTLFSGDL